MSFTSTKQRVQVITAVLFLAVVALASRSGPEPGYTGAPNDLGTCVACHDKHQLNEGPGSVRIQGLPEVYQPGTSYNFTVTTAQSGRVRFGFQLTAISSTGARAGTLSNADFSTQVLGATGAGGRQYIEHTDPGTDAVVLGSRTWQLRWTAPSTDIGTVRFFTAGNAADNTGVQDDNDFIYTSIAFSDSPSSHVTFDFQSEPGGETLPAGSVFNISWGATGSSNIDNFELRYSTDDGATFPITNLILATTNPSVTSVGWNVPDKPTTQARIRMIVGKKSGDAVTVITDRFTITGTGGPPAGPEIIGASVSGKKLFVSGNNYQIGALLYSCSGCETPVTEGKKVKKVFNDSEEPSTLIFSKKAGKDISPGSTIRLQVKNPDGGTSPPFDFTRPN
jgi:hypothetical protein